jgi:hypothetical protein
MFFFNQSPEGRLPARPCTSGSPYTDMMMQLDICRCSAIFDRPEFVNHPSVSKLVVGSATSGER